MQLTLLKGYPDFVGKRATFVGWGNGPAVYHQATGDVVTLPMPNYYIDALFGGVNSVSGAYFVRAQSVGVGARQKWALFWYTAAGASVPDNSVLLAGEQIQIGGLCGQY
jgi:hypothetical protein